MRPPILPDESECKAGRPSPGQICDGVAAPQTSRPEREPPPSPRAIARASLFEFQSSRLQALLLRDVVLIDLAADAIDETLATFSVLAVLQREDVDAFGYPVQLDNSSQLYPWIILLCGT